VYCNIFDSDATFTVGERRLVLDFGGTVDSKELLMVFLRGVTTDFPMRYGTGIQWNESHTQPYTSIFL
jgi:hypothetical protein